MRPTILIVVLLSGLCFHPVPGAEIDGEARVWHPVSLRISGPQASETDDRPNPFLDHRLQVRFESPDGRVFLVPAFFDGDGKGGPSGTAWRARFTPDRSGRWRYAVSARSGDRIAIGSAEGTPLACDGTNGSFDVSPRDPQAAGFWKWGRLAYVGKHYLKFADGPYWIKGGADEPENLLAYAGFDNTPASHKFADHVSDWRQGDPDWGDGKGKAMIGALNYLAQHHVNSIYFLVMNIGGDGDDVWPWVGKPRKKGSSEDDNLHFDLGKLNQWNIVFEHAQRLGIALHIVFNEAEKENKQEIDNGELGVERKLYYREMVSRFGHHPAIVWNLCEEYNLDFNLGHDRLRAFADELRTLDAYHHPITVHSAGDPVKMLAFTFGDPRFETTSVQLNQKRIDIVTENIREATAKAGRPLPASMDEFTVDRGQKASHIPVDDPDGQRKEKLWPTYLSGGNIEFILEGLLKMDSFKTPKRQLIWDQTWYARKFLEALPFWEMEPADPLVRGAVTLSVGMGAGKRSELPAQVFQKPGQVYAVYFPRAEQTGELNLSEAQGSYRQRWYNPRTGEFDPAEKVINGGNWIAPGAPPCDPHEDWTLLIERQNQPLASVVFPGKSWVEVRPETMSLDPAKLEKLARELGGRGCVIKNGYVIKSWGNQALRRDWASSAKPVLSTLLLFALKEGKIKSVDQPIRDFGWPLSPKDSEMTFRHLGGMFSGYARPDKPGTAWAYNDFAINLYQKTLFDKVYQGEPDAIANAPERLGALGLEDRLAFRPTNRRLSASVRDFARLDWFWLNKGNWNGKQLLPRFYFDEYMRPQVPKLLPAGAAGETNDYLKIGTYGGGSDHFSVAGPGIYGFNWWFNQTGRQHPDRKTWPDAPDDTVMTLGVRGNSSAFIPSLRVVLVVAEGNWGEPDPGNADARQNQVLKWFVDAVTPTK